MLLLTQGLSLELEVVKFGLTMSVAVEQSRIFWSVQTVELVFIIVVIMKMLV